MAKELKKRSEQRTEDTWDLTAIYKDEAAFDADVKKMEDIIKDIAGREGKLCESGKTLKEYFELDEELNQIAERAFNYVQRMADQDTKNTENQAKRMKLSSRYSELASTIAFVEPELLAGLLFIYRQYLAADRVARDHGIGVFEVGLCRLDR
ncbi:MAG: hypothetical protein J6U42_02640, partial [Lachnospiraceae bacterium]|nr:hypothetical protein [Lachnospiraceae bacterium]